MRLRFSVDQSESLRHGIDCPKSIITVEVNPAKLSQADRDLIAVRMEGIDVCQLDKDGDKLFNYQHVRDPFTNALTQKATPARLQAKVPTFEGLMEAIHANEAEVAKKPAGARP